MFDVFIIFSCMANNKYLGMDDIFLDYLLFFSDQKASTKEVGKMVNLSSIIIHYKENNDLVAIYMTCYTKEFCKTLEVLS